MASRSMMGGSGGGSGGYKVLCVSSLHPKASDDVITQTLYREYKKYGDVSVRVVQEPDERVAYVYFRNFEDARDARHSKSRIILFDQPAVVEAVYESRSSESSAPQPPASHYSRRRSLTPPPPHGHGGYAGGGGGGGGRYRSRSPVPERSRYRDYGGRDDYGPPHREPYGGGRHSRGRGGGGGGGGGHIGGGDRSYDYGGGGGYPDPKKRERDYRKDKFPNYLDHIPPEEDPLSTRTLFAGNLELNITDEEIRRIFGRYGRLVDIDIKRPAPGTGNAYAFIRYENLDQAHRAKVELSGQYIGKFQCKVGYGKINATPKVWVGGLGTWTTVSMLEREFDRFGAIKTISYQRGDQYAHILYETLDAAQAAVREMRGFPLGGPDKRLRCDYVDMEVPGGPGGPGGPAGAAPPPPPSHKHVEEPYHDRGRGGGRFGYSGGRDVQRGGPPRQDSYHWQRRPNEEDDGGDNRPPRSRRVESGGVHEDVGQYSPGERSARSNISGVKSIAELCSAVPKVWEGGLALKNSLFPTKLYLIEGGARICEQFADDANQGHLKITQRLRLDKSKLDDVRRKLTSSSHAVFLAVSTTTNIPTASKELQSRPLRNLIVYLKQKEAAGVISMTFKDWHSPGVLYCFPPCDFSLELLNREAPALAVEEEKDDYLVILVVCENDK